MPKSKPLKPIQRIGLFAVPACVFGLMMAGTIFLWRTHLNLNPSGPFLLPELSEKPLGASLFNFNLLLVAGFLLSLGLASLVFLILSSVNRRQRAERKVTNLARKVLAAQEQERARIARDLHDEIGQLLTALRFELSIIQKQGGEISSPETLFKRPFQLLEQAVGELRRICRGLRPPLLDDLGLGPAVQFLTEEFEERSGIYTRLDLRLNPTETLGSEIPMVIYRILQESFTNIARHSEASEVEISIARLPDSISMSVTDNGRGFLQEEAMMGEGSGLTGMLERASLVGGRLAIHSAPRKGTKLDLTIPL